MRNKIADLLHNCPLDKRRILLAELAELLSDALLLGAELRVEVGDEIDRRDSACEEVGAGESLGLWEVSGVSGGVGPSAGIGSGVRLHPVYSRLSSKTLLLRRAQLFLPFARGTPGSGAISVHSLGHMYLKD